MTSSCYQTRFNLGISIKTEAQCTFLKPVSPGCFVNIFGTTFYSYLQGLIYICILSKVNIWNVNYARATAFIFATRTDSCESVKVFETENIPTWGGLEPPTFGFMPNALAIWAIRARHLLSHVFEYWLWRYRYFQSKANIWNVDGARAPGGRLNKKDGLTRS